MTEFLVLFVALHELIGAGSGESAISLPSPDRNTYWKWSSGHYKRSGTPKVSVRIYYDDYQ